MSDETRMALLHHSTNDLVEELLMWRSLAAEHLDRIAELEAAQARWVMASERLPKVSGWYLTGLVYFLGSPYSSEVYFDAENIEPRWNNITSDKIYCWLDGVPELPQPPEVQK